VLEANSFDETVFREPNNDRRLPIHYRGTQPDVSEAILLEPGSLGDVNAYDCSGRSVLHFAVREGWREMVQHIIEIPTFPRAASWDVLAVVVNPRRNAVDIMAILMRVGP
jgi:hypothetical protein